MVYFFRQMDLSNTLAQAFVTYIQNLATLFWSELQWV